MVAIATLETRVSWLLSCLHPSEKGLHRFVQTPDNVLQHMGMDVFVFRPELLDSRQIILLLIVANGDLLHTPGFFSFCQGGVIQLPTAPEGIIKP